MRIAMFTAEFPPYPGGIATYSYELAAAARRIGHEVVVFVFGRDPQRSDTFEIVPIRPYFFETQKFPLAMLAMLQQISKRRFDLLFATDLKDMLAASILPTRIERRAAAIGTDARSRVLTKYLRFYKPYLRFNKIIAISAFTRGLVLKHHRYLPPGRVIAAPLGVDKYWFDRPLESESAALTQRIGPLHDRIVLLSVGRIEPRKGQQQAIAALQALPEHLRSRVTYLIVGRVVEKDYGQVLAQEAARSNCDVRLIGDIPRGELRALYAISDLLVHTATTHAVRAEGFGLVVLEAAAAGVPTIATRVDALPEVVVDGVTGLLAEDRNLGDIIDKIALMIGHREERRKPFQESCRKFAAGYTWERCAELSFG